MQCRGSTGADVLPLPPARIVLMLARFAELDAKGQASFLDTLNAYLYASPQQRTRLRDAWCQAVEGDPGRGHGALPCEEPAGRP